MKMGYIRTRTKSHVKFTSVTAKEYLTKEMTKGSVSQAADIFNELISCSTRQK